MIPPAFDQVLEDDRSCAVRVAVPPALMPAHGWSVAYVLDLRQFDMMRADPGGLPGLLVGLEPGVPEDRRWDYVPAGMSPDMGQSLRTAPCLRWGSPVRRCPRVAVGSARRVLPLCRYCCRPHRLGLQTTGTEWVYLLGNC